jgi:hypothetical protein
MPLYERQSIAGYGKTVELEREPHGTLLDSVLSKPYVPAEHRDLLDVVLNLTDSYNAAAADRVRQIEKNLAWGKAERKRITDLDIARELIEADCRRVERVWDAAVAARAEDKEWRRLQRNTKARERRARKRMSRVCVCGSAHCDIGPFTTREELEASEADSD